MNQGNRHKLLYSELDRLVTAMSKHKAFRIATFGVFDGIRCGHMMKHVRDRGRPNVELYGFDLFEDMTPVKNVQEVGKSTLAPSVDQVRKNVRKFGEPNALKLFKGDSVELLPRIVKDLPPMDLVFVDGGHSLRSVYSDAYHAFQMVAPHGTVAFDDVYAEDMTKGAFAMTEWLRSLPTKHGVSVTLSDADVTKLRIQIAVVRSKTRLDKLMTLRPDDTPKVRGESANAVLIDEKAETSFRGPDVDLAGTSPPSVTPAPGSYMSTHTGKTKPLDVPVTEKVFSGGLTGDQLFGMLLNGEHQAKASEAVQEYTRAKMAEGKHIHETVRQILQPTPSEPTDDPGTGGGDPDVRPVAVRTDGGDQPAEQHPELDSGGGGRREPGLEPEPVQEAAPEPADPAPLPDERPQPDPQLELGGGEGDRAEHPVHGGGEQRPEVPAPAPAEPAVPGPDVVAAAQRRPGPGRPGPRRANDKRPGS